MNADEYLKANGWDTVLGSKDFGNGDFAAVIPMFVTERIIEGNIDDNGCYERYWCYERGVVRNAIVAMYYWNDKGSEPVGWVKSWDQRRRRYIWDADANDYRTEQSTDNGSTWSPLVADTAMASN